MLDYVGGTCGWLVEERALVSWLTLEEQVVALKRARKLAS